MCASFASEMIVSAGIFSRYKCCFEFVSNSCTALFLRKNANDGLGRNAFTIAMDDGFGKLSLIARYIPISNEQSDKTQET